MFVPWTDAGDQVGQQFIKDFPEMTFYRNSHYTFDVVNRGISKGTGMNILLNQPALRDIPTYAFGDGYNDIPFCRQPIPGSRWVMLILKLLPLLTIKPMTTVVMAFPMHSRIST